MTEIIKLDLAVESVQNLQSGADGRLVTKARAAEYHAHHAGIAKATATRHINLAVREGLLIEHDTDDYIRRDLLSGLISNGIESATYTLRDLATLYTNSTKG